MPYALFSNDARLSKVYPTEADVWKVARASGLVADVATEQEPTHVLDNHYEIGPAIPSRMKILPGTRWKPRATPGPNRRRRQREVLQ